MKAKIAKKYFGRSNRRTSKPSENKAANQKRGDTAARRYALATRFEWVKILLESRLKEIRTIEGKGREEIFWVVESEDVETIRE